MEELIPFIFFIAWLIFGGLGSKKKREQAARKQQEARQQAEADRAARAEQRGATRESREAGGRITYPEAQPSSTSDTSLDMIPDELWSILTGGAPRPTQPSGRPHAEREPTGDGGWVTSPPYDEEDAVHSIEGVSGESGGENAVDYDDAASSTARARYADLTATTWDEKPTSRDAMAIRRGDTSEARHDEFHDRLIASGAPAAVARRPINVQLGLRSISDVRRAIVLAEILGPPKALR